MKRNEDKVDWDARIILRENEIRIIRVLFSTDQQNRKKYHQKRTLSFYCDIF